MPDHGASASFERHLRAGVGLTFGISFPVDGPRKAAIIQKLLPSHYYPWPIFGGILCWNVLMDPLRRFADRKEPCDPSYHEGHGLCFCPPRQGKRAVNFAKGGFQGLGFAFVYCQSVEDVSVASQKTRYSDTCYKARGLNGLSCPPSFRDITPEYMGGRIYHRYQGLRVWAGGRSVLSWFVMQPLLASLIDRVGWIRGQTGEAGLF